MITTKQETAIRDVLATMPELAVGVGTREQACSIAALNLALTGTLTDTVPDCMSPVIGRWIISVQDRMPATIRDSQAWRDLLVLSAGTGSEHEAERVALVMAWMWDALALVQPQADARGYGVAWATMLRERTVKSANSAAAAAYAYAAAHASAYADAAAHAAAHAAESADAHAFAWTAIDPVGLLRRLVAVTDDRALAVQP